MVYIAPVAGPWITWVGLGLILGDPHLTCLLGELFTFHMLVLELREEAGDAIRGDGKGDASCNLECVDADDLTILGRESEVWGYLVECKQTVDCC